jgi:two-component system sensor histidine kinase SenX3
VTAPVASVLAIVALMVGVAVGLLIARTRRKRVERQPTGPTVAELLQRLVRSSNSGVVVLNRFGDMVLHNPRAYELGLVRVAQADSRARQAAEQVVETDEPMEIDLSPTEARGRQPEAVLAEVRPLGDGFTVVEAVDHSDAVRLEATRRDFVANVSHELKTPAAALGLLAEALQQAADDPVAVRRFSVRTQRESSRLASLVQDLVDLSRLEGAERHPDPELIRLDRAVAEAVDRVRTTAQSRGIAVVRSGDHGVQVRGSEAQLTTALGNLLENAVNYSPDGARVVIGARTVHEPDGSVVEVNVVDEGIGIAHKDVERVFERFYRADPARSRATGGTGLGLAIVKHVATNHGGTVTVRSTEGYGSTFTLRLPALPEETLS